MATVIQIKRSPATSAPGTLKLGELAYTYGTGSQSNLGDRIFIGEGGVDSNGDANNVSVIGGQYFTDMLDHVQGTLTGNSAIIADSNLAIDTLNVGNSLTNGGEVRLNDETKYLEQNTGSNSFSDNNLWFDSSNHTNNIVKGGLMVHYVPSKYHPYSLLLRLVGHQLQKVLITALRPEAAEVSGYLAFFNLCSPRQMRRACEKAGFKDIKITCYYRATDYFSFFVPAFILVALWENICAKFCLETMAAGFIIEARK